MQRFYGEKVRLAEHQARNDGYGSNQTQGGEGESANSFYCYVTHGGGRRRLGGEKAVAGTIHNDPAAREVAPPAREEAFAPKISVRHLKIGDAVTHAR